MSLVTARRPELDSESAEYYDQAPEEDRLQHGAFLLESLRTRELIQRYAPATPATVVDIGGAAGAYALWLAEMGYTVHLLDPVARLVAEARRRSATRSHPLASCEVGDARAMNFGDQTADMVLRTQARRAAVRRRDLALGFNAGRFGPRSLSRPGVPRDRRG